MSTPFDEMFADMFGQKPQSVAGQIEATIRKIRESAEKIKADKQEKETSQ